MILTSTNLQSLAKNLDYADGKSILTTAGIHPTSCSEIDDENSEFRGDSYFTELRKIIDSNLDKIICIGECGLDYDPDREKFCPRQIQQKYFKKQLQLAKDYKMPIFLHCRGESSYIDLFKIMREVLQKPKFPEAVVHSFTSGLDDAKLCLEHGCFIGLNGV